MHKGPAQKLKNTLQAKSDNLLHDWMEQQQYNLQKTLELLDEQEFSRAVHTLRTARKVFLYAKKRLPCACAAAGIPAPADWNRYLPHSIGQVRTAGKPDADGADDLVILFGFSKVSAEGRFILDYQKRAGYRTLLFTSRAYHDEKCRADINLFVYRGEEDEYHSMTAPIAVADALVLVLSAEMGPAAVERLEEIRKLKAEYAK